MAPGATAPMSEAELLAILKANGVTVKDLKELTSKVSGYEGVVKERDTYKTRFSTYGKMASEAGHKSLDEVFKAAAEARKKTPGGNGDFRTKMSDLYLKTYGTEEHGRLMKEDPRMFEFWSSVIQDALGTIPTDKFLTQDKLDEFKTMMGDHLSEKDFLYGLSPEDRARVKPFLKDIRNIYAEEELFNPPAGSDDSYDGFAEAWKRYQAKMEKAGVKMSNEEKRTPDEQARRIAFPGVASPSAADGDNKPGPGFDEKRFRAENPDVFDGDGNFKWEDGFGLGAGG